MQLKRKVRQPIFCAISLTLLAGGCQSSHNTPTAGGDMTFQRGAQLLASGSPKSAIPTYTQTIGFAARRA